tara:strand:+ start:2389 stop:2748 length:360 start_codon:yes stop_codon:yes gene_type:complete
MENQYKQLVLPNDVKAGDVVQIKYDTEGIVYDLFDNSMEECKEEFGYDLYEDTTIPKFYANITLEDLNNISNSGYKVVLACLQAVETTSVENVTKVVSELKEQVYKACPILSPKNPVEE